MKRHLNGDERQLWGLTNELTTGFAGYIEKHGKNMGPNERKYMKTCITYFRKALEALFLRVGQEEGNKMIRMFRDSEVQYKARTSGKDEELVQIGLDLETIHQLAHGMIESYCKTCTLDETPKKSNGTASMTVHDCKIRDLFVTCFVPGIDESGICPYKYE